MTLKNNIQKEIFAKMKDKFGYVNIMETPKIEKVVVSVGVGSFKDKKKIELVLDRLTKITGQKPVLRGAKKSIASFKTRQGDPVGVQVVLRGSRMQGFLGKLLNIGFPRTKDFRGIQRTVVDNMGNVTLGIKEHTIFPETSDEEIKDVFGLAVTMVVSSKTKEETFGFLEAINFPFRKDRSPSFEA
ncbi:MAG: 50S ribosomal protein L5 [bacterium]|nr:50S ribosomal protein L5 [bacterium]